MKTKLTFAERAKQIEKKYPDRDLNTIQQRTFDYEMESLMKENEQAKLAMGATEIYNKKFAMGGELDGYNPEDIYGATEPANIPGLKIPIGFVPTTNYGQPIQLGLEAQNYTTPKINPLPILTPQFVNSNTSSTESIMPERTSAENGLLSGAMSAFKGSLGNVPETPDYLKPVMYGKSAEFLTKAATMLGGPEKELPTYNPYEQAVLEKFRTRINDESIRNDVLAGRNAALDQVDSRSMNIRNAFSQNIENNTGRTLAEQNRATQMQNIQLDNQEGQVLNQMGQNQQQVNMTIQQYDSQNRAAFDNNISTLSESVGNFGQAMTNYKAGNLQQAIMAMAIRTSNFEVRDEILKDIQAGRLIDITKALKFTNGDTEAANNLVEQSKQLQDKNKGL